MKITVLGTGYVGLIQATGLAKIGFDVTAIDIVEEKIELLKQGTPTIYESGLDDLLKETRGKIHFTTDFSQIRGSAIIFLCVPTPQNDTGETNLRFLQSACDMMVPLLSGDEIIVVKSTVPVGSNKKVYEFLGAKNPVVSNPEFLREGIAVYDFFHPTRINFGFRNNEEPRVKEVLRELYSYFTQKGVPIFEMDWATAELTKYAANAFLATKITFMNEIARLADASGADVRLIKDSLGVDPRIGSKHLAPGIGYGGSCFPKDVKSLIHQFHHHNLSGSIIENVDTVNEGQPQYFFEKILKFYNGDIHGKTFALVGIAFKPDTDDLRESKAIDILRLLLDAGATVRAFDYNEKARENFGKFAYSLTTEIKTYVPVSLHESFHEVIAGVDALVVTLEDPRIQKESLKDIHLKDRVIFDGRNILEKESVIAQGLFYFGVGC